MSFKNIVRDLGERSVNKSIIGRRGRSHIAPEGSASSSSSSSNNQCLNQSIWVDLPPELLLDIIHRIESEQTLWPARRDIVACASVCRSWREMTKELVKVPELSGLLTFPISLKQVYFLSTLFFCSEPLIEKSFKLTKKKTLWILVLAWS